MKLNINKISSIKSMMGLLMVALCMMAWSASAIKVNDKREVNPLCDCSRSKKKCTTQTEVITDVIITSITDTITSVVTNSVTGSTSGQISEMLITTLSSPPISSVFTNTISTTISSSTTNSVRCRNIIQIAIASIFTVIFTETVDGTPTVFSTTYR